MNRAELLDFLLTHGCIIVREDNKGYTVLRNVQNGMKSGLPANDPLRAATVCRICKNLGIDDLPENEGVRVAMEIVNMAHNDHNGKA